MPEPVTAIQRAGDRFHTVSEWSDTWHSFSYGVHYDAANVGFGALLVHNDERLAAGQGYDEHRHTEAEIVTWVVSGALDHRDSAGHEHVLTPGWIQLLSAGAGVVHAERAAASGPVRFIQTWVRPDEFGLAPAYALADIADRLSEGWVCAASGGNPAAAITIGSTGSTLWISRLRPGDRRKLRRTRRWQVFVARGVIEVPGVGVLSEGDALRLVDAPEQELVAVSEAEVMAWELGG